jgi:uncharacterized protein YdeI (YjbR/CyaY-like superfamily)
VTLNVGSPHPSGTIAAMARAHDEGERIHPEGPAEWGRWLEEHHDREAGVWLVTWRKHTGRSQLGYEEAVTEALRFGWIDSRPSALDDERTMLWFSPRRAGSAWAGPNKERIARLAAKDRLAPAGAAMVAAAKADGSWTRLDGVERLEVPDDLAAAFAEHAGSRERWDAFPPSARRAILEWIVQARREPTRAKRVTETARLAARGERANQWRPKGAAAAAEGSSRPG